MGDICVRWIKQFTGDIYLFIKKNFQI